MLNKVCILKKKYWKLYGKFYNTNEHHKPLCCSQLAPPIQVEWIFIFLIKIIYAPSGSWIDNLTLHLPLR